MKTMFTNRVNYFVCKYCGDALACTLIAEIASVKRKNMRRKMFCGNECAKAYREEKQRGKQDSAARARSNDSQGGNEGVARKDR